ncbi:a-pheromone processing metallopeptidase ste23 [Colletotrichum kahawae]|uniref:A-pheromone processing metallopeptidase ste23 n=1 Tax=Colletotrichum kahawae TaxID=34407 RepID=A0AAE0D7T2_COLKA|nr:a-pheromone processing metallopeptidase ste23 [Colletotrichum kahawae]
MTAPKPKPIELVTKYLEKPLADKRTYRVIRLSNKLEALLVHDPETDKASAALDVNVGNFSDEEDMPGVAHAVEHLLFMGTRKFPIENEFSRYLAINFGSHNACTGETSTNYHFDVSAKPANNMEASASNPSPFEGALDRFAQFFIEPLFLKSTLDRELCVIDSEHKKNIRSDEWRLEQLNKSLSNPKHPFSYFDTGNLEVLKAHPEAKGIDVRDKVMEFHEKHYSANRMKLVVLGREPLHVLEDWVGKLFTGVPNKNLVPNRWEAEVPFRESELGVQVFAKSVLESRKLNLVFPFLDLENMFESQPGRYASHLIGHKGPGSIMTCVKEKGWANGISARAYPVCPGTPGIFECTMDLTDEGLKNYKQIVQIFFQYVSLLRESKPQKWIFDEIKVMDDTNFKHQQKTEPIHFTEETSATMQKPVPRKWLLGDGRLRKFDSELIKKGLACLRPDSFRLTIVSPKYPGDWNQTERIYGTRYRKERIPDDFMADIEKAASSSAPDRLVELHLPHKNIFIPTKLEVEKMEVEKPAVAPRVVRNDKIARAWFKKDDTFWVPKAELFIGCRNPNIYSTAENAVKATLFTQLVMDALECYSYAAELAGLQYSVTIDARGLFLSLGGYNHKLDVLLEKVLATMRNLEMKYERFIVISERLNRDYSNRELEEPFHQVSAYTASLNSERNYVVEEYLAGLSNITAEDVCQFKKHILSQVHIESYVLGNLYKDDALKLTNMIEKILEPRELPNHQWPVIRSLVLPAGSNYIYKKTLKDTANINHCIEMWLYIGDESDRMKRARTLLLGQMIPEPAFDQLRTKEQLGYIVFSGYLSFSTTCGFCFTIQSEKNPGYLEWRIEEFLKSFSKTLESMSEATFKDQKQSLISERLEKPLNLEWESCWHWDKICSESYDFDRSAKDAAIVETITKEDMIEFYDRHMNPGSQERAKLSVHLHAQTDDSIRHAETAEIPEASSKAVPITNVHDFRNGLHPMTQTPVGDLEEFMD